MGKRKGRRRVNEVRGVGGGRRRGESGKKGLQRTLILIRGEIHNCYFLGIEKNR